MFQYVAEVIIDAPYSLREELLEQNKVWHVHSAGTLLGTGSSGLNMTSTATCIYALRLTW